MTSSFQSSPKSNTSINSFRRKSSGDVLNSNSHANNPQPGSLINDHGQAEQQIQQPFASESQEHQDSIECSLSRSMGSLPFGRGIVSRSSRNNSFLKEKIQNHTASHSTSISMQQVQINPEHGRGLDECRHENLQSLTQHSCPPSTKTPLKQVKVQKLMNKNTKNLQNFNPSTVPIQRRSKTLSVNSVIIESRENENEPESSRTLSCEEDNSAGLLIVKNVVDDRICKNQSQGSSSTVSSEYDASYIRGVRVVIWLGFWGIFLLRKLKIITFVLCK